MLKRLVKRLLRIGIEPDRSLMHLQEMENLAHAGTAAWLLAQEKARIEYLSAQEQLTRSGSLRALPLLFHRFVRLQSTNAIIQSLLNEHQLERLVSRARKRQHGHEKRSR